MRKTWIPRLRLSSLPIVPYGLELTPIGYAVLLARKNELGLDLSDFLNPLYAQLQPVDARLLNKLLNLLKSSLLRSDRVIVYGDYDVDGITSTFIVAYTLKALGFKPVVYLPNRFKEGYGLNHKALKVIEELARKYSAGLVVTVDNGVTAYDEIAYLKAKGLKVIVIDHHTFSKLPPADLVVHPALNGVGYEGLTAGGVAFKIGMALKESLDLKLNPNLLYVMAALSTVADVAPLLGENRVIVVKGLRALQRLTPPWMMELWTLSGRKGRPSTVFDLGFIIAPRLNAAGRMKDPKLAFKLLVESDEEKVRAVAEVIEELNRVRRREQDRALRKILERGDGIFDSVIVPTPDEGYHEGVIGIVAGKLSEMYGKPAFVTSRIGEELKGSARSPFDELSVVKALREVSQLLSAYGGHEKAGGFSLSEDRFEAFRKGLKEYYDSLSHSELTLIYDFELIPQMYPYLMTFLKRDMERLRPFGEAYPEPTLKLLGKVVGYSPNKIKLMPYKQGYALELNLEERASVELFETYELIVRFSRNKPGYHGSILHMEPRREKLFLTSNEIGDDIILKIITPGRDSTSELPDKLELSRMGDLEDLSGEPRENKYEAILSNPGSILFFSSLKSMNFILSNLRDLLKEKASSQVNHQLGYWIYLPKPELDRLRYKREELVRGIKVEGMHPVEQVDSNKVIVCSIRQPSDLVSFLKALSYRLGKLRLMILPRRLFELVRGDRDAEGYVNR